MSELAHVRQTGTGVGEPDPGTRAQPHGNDTRAALEHLSARRAAKHASAVIASIQDGLITVDEHGRIVDVNAVLCDMTGFRREQLLGSRAPYPFWPTADAGRNGRTLTDLLRGEFAEGGSCQLTFCRANGDRFDANVVIAPLRDRYGISIGFAATIRELTAAPPAVQPALGTAGDARYGAAMRRVAAAVAAGASTGAIYQRIAEAATCLVGADAARIVRIDAGTTTMMGTWAQPGFDPRRSAGTELTADIRRGADRWGVIQTNTATGRVTRPEAQKDLDCFATLVLALGTMNRPTPAVAGRVGKPATPAGEATQIRSPAGLALHSSGAAG